MTSDRREKRRAYEEAKTRLRAFRERYYPGHALGARTAETVTPEVLQELSRLEAASETARVSWEASMRS
jgi:hypothetical protein